MAGLSDAELEKRALASLDKIILEQKFKPAPADICEQIGLITLTLLANGKPVTRESLVDGLMEALELTSKRKSADALYEKDCLIIQAAIKRVLDIGGNG